MKMMYFDALAQETRNMVTSYKTVAGLKKRMLKAIAEDGDKAGFSVMYDMGTGRYDVYRHYGHTVSYTPGYQETMVVPRRCIINADDSVSIVDMLYCEKRRMNGNIVIGRRAIREVE